tara:strand:- start:803 stop:2635 length:1833 start_codon:yes stop_codon:yes gene_type:complete
MAIKYLSNISLEGNELQNVKIHPVGTAPTNGQGKLYYDTATNKLMANDGSSWYSVNGSLEDLTSGNTSRITIGGTAAAPTVDVVTGAVVNGGAGLSTQDQIHDFVTTQIGNLPSQVVTSLGLSANTLTYTDENGNDTTIDLSLYLDDSNLARLTSGAINSSTGLATFTRDDASTFTIDMSAFLDGITVNNTLTSTSTSQGLSAAQGKALKDLIDALPTEDTNTQLSDSDIATLGYIKDYTVTEADVTQHEAALTVGYSQLTGTPTIPTNNNQLGNGAGYIDDYTVTESDVTAHEAALTITESQISDLSHFDGNYNSLSNLPTLAPSNAEQNVQSNWNATTGDALILNKPSLFDGNYNSLSNLPSLFDGDYDNLSNLPSLFDGAYASLSGLPSLAPSNAEQNVQSDWNAASGDALILNKPSLFDGAYGSLTGTPTIPTNNNQLTNGESYISDYTVTSGDVTAHEGSITITESQISDLSHFSGSYNDLTNQPSIPTVSAASTTAAGIIEIATNTEAKAGTLTNRAVTPQGLQQSVDQEHTANRAVVTIGNGTDTTLTATHNFGNQKCLVSVMEVASGDEVYAEIIKNTNDVSVIFASAPASNAYEVSMLKMS